MSGTGCTATPGHCCGGSWCMGGNCSCDHTPRCCTYVAPTEQPEPTTSELPIGPKLGVATEQTEAQDGWTVEKEIAALKNEGMDSTVEVIESLRAQLEAARGERDALQRDATAWKSVAESREMAMDFRRAELAQKMQEHQDALSEMWGRMEWAMRHISGKAWREAGIEYGQVEDIPGLIDAALSPPSEGAAV